MTNTGNVTLDPVAVDDPAVGTVACPATTLAPGASTTCTATYTLTQADVDAGHFANTATATGTPPTGADVEATDSTDTLIAAGPVDHRWTSRPGCRPGTPRVPRSTTRFVVTNTGNVTLDPVAVDDPAVGTVDCPATTLAPGESTTCTATYTLTQVDVDAGHFANTATATGTPPTGADVEATDSTDTLIAAGASITLDKQAGRADGEHRGVHDRLQLRGDQHRERDAGPVAVDDPTVGTVACPATTLAPGESTTCTATYTLTQADVDAGTSRTPRPRRAPRRSVRDVTATRLHRHPIPAGPSITLDKQVGRRREYWRVRRSTTASW